ncbi:tetratricopeptide repeat protein [Candidatus Fermentibacteria bacterium]|nr:tetratricopeptide repeat protein [Candidatus Fermentibacteria bacterium]
MNEDIEQLKARIEQESEPCNRVELIAMLAWTTKYSDPGRAVELGEQALELAQEHGCRDGVGMAYLAAAMGNLHQSHFETSEKLARSALDIYEKQEKQEGLRSAHNVIGSVYLRWGKHADALSHFLASLRIDEQLGEGADPGITSNLGQVYMHLGDYENALDYFLRAKSQSDGMTGPADLKAVVFINLGSVYKALDDPRTSLDFFSQGLEICEANDMLQATASTYSEMGHAEGMLGRFEDARESLLHSLEMFEQMGDAKGAADTLVRLGDLEMKAGAVDKALTYYQESIDTYAQLEDLHGTIEAMLGKATGLIRGNPKGALKILQSIREQASGHRSLSQLHRLHKLLSEANEKVGNAEEALASYKEQHRLELEIRSERTQKRLQSLKMSNEVDRAHKEAEIYRLQTQELSRSKEELEELVRKRTQELESEIRIRQLSEDFRRQLEMEFGRDQRLASLGELAGGIAHDFNNVLTVISGNAEMARLETDPDSIHERIDALLKATANGAALTGQLLAFSRHRPIKREPVDIGKVVRETTTMLKRTMGRRVTVNLELPEESLYVLGDRQQLQQVLMNLVLNARDAVEEGGTITIFTSRPALDRIKVPANRSAAEYGYVILAVSDDGMGIPREIQDRIFDPLFTTKESGQGTGLGLSVVHGIVTQLDGWIDIESEVGHGTTFRAYLPQAAVRPSGAEVEDEATAKGSTGHGEKILLVEDNQDVLDFVAAVLQTRGYRVIKALTKKQALNLYEQESGEIDLLFIDVMLPDGSGIDLARELTSEKPETPVILGSGFTPSKDAWDYVESNAVPFLEKPYSVASLFDAVSNSLRGAEQL